MSGPEQIKWGLGPTAPAGPGQSPGLTSFLHAVNGEEHLDGGGDDAGRFFGGDR